MKLIVGLGNPGREYACTRHNVGWLLLDALAERLGAGRFRDEKAVEVAEARLDSEKLYLMKPQTFMNRSGQALSSWLGRFRDVRETLRDAAEVRRCVVVSEVKPEKGSDEVECRWPGILVVSDDVHLPLGRLRFRSSGSAGGHNGLKDIEKALGGRGYPRLRLGVDPPPERMSQVDYVLGKFTPDETPVLERMIQTGARAAADWALLGMEAVQDRYNGKSQS